MSYDFQIGSNPIPESAPSKLTFHQYTIYDSALWTESGYLYWDASAKQFTVMPSPPSEVKAPEPTAVKKSVYKR